jgi:tetratricopeptide (TPR) repeat protein
LRFYIIEVGKYLQKKRNGLGLKLKYFANQGISPSTISKIENGSPNVSEEMILKYARLLNVKEEELIQLSQTNVHTPDFWIDEIDFLENMLELDPDQVIEKAKEHYSEHPIYPYLMGKAYRVKNQYPKAMKYFIEAIRLCKKEHDYLNIKPAAQISAGNIHFYQKQLDLAIKLTEEAKESWVPEGERSYLYSYILMNLAIYYRKAERYEDFEEAVNELWSHKEQLDSAETKVIVIEHQAWLLYNHKQYDKALRLIKEGILLARLNQLWERRLDLWTLQGDIYRMKNEDELAIQSYQAAIATRKKLAQHKIIPACIKCALLYLKQKKFEQANELLQLAQTVCDSNTPTNDQIDLMITLGEVNLQQGNLEKAADYFTQALSFNNIPEKKKKVALISLCQCYEVLDKQKFEECKTALFHWGVQHKEEAL